MIIKQLRSFWLKKTKYVIMIFLMQMVLIIGVLFLSGVIVNNAKSINEDVWKTLMISLNFNDKVRYDEIEPAIIKCVKKYPNLVNEISVSKILIDDGAAEEKYIQIISQSKLKNGKYYCGDSIVEDMRRLDWGRMYTEEEVINKKLVAVVYDYDVSGRKNIVIDNKTYDIIGEIYSPEKYGASVVKIPITCFYDIEISSISLSTNIIMSNSQINYLTKELDKIVAGKYDLMRDEGDIPDGQSIARTIILESTLILFVILSSIIMLYSYLLNESKYRLSVWKLIGCQNSKAALYFTGTMAIVLFLSTFLGIVIFIYSKKMILEKIYTYMEDFYNVNIYIGIPTVIYMITIICIYLFSLWKTRGRVRRNLI